MCNTGAQIITYTIVGVPHYNNYSIMGPPNPILVVKAPRVGISEMAVQSFLGLCQDLKRCPAESCLLQVYYSEPQKVGTWV